MKRLLDEGKTPPEIVSELYLRCFSRRPTEEEAKAINDNWRRDGSASGVEDVFWALLNSREFLFNH